jgi:hypothetical protein
MLGTNHALGTVWYRKYGDNQINLLPVLETKATLFHPYSLSSVPKNEGFFVTENCG